MARESPPWLSSLCCACARLGRPPALGGDVIASTACIISEYKREAVASGVAFRIVSESAGLSPLLLPPFRQPNPHPLDILFPPKRPAAH
ncbi:hypothetical protein EVAR_67819_1 [Eumeta japonica]|uniref:Uncharacterized protein n=1 Tax=Eumeta variegata TaxID=151549 RepID=A0A4C1ZR96_EUMVA|nr:hypothetical protein EVAR_67819_1 [Eumeta japonica]